jgi:predicted aspartyl protease
MVKCKSDRAWPVQACANLAIMRNWVGRIIAPVTIENVSESAKSLRCDALVDTGASHLVLPKAWMERLALNRMQELSVETATQQIVMGELCGPARIQIEGFRPIYNEVLFVDMQPEDGFYAPLLGYLVLEQSGAAVDILGHRLLHVKHMDLKLTRAAFIDFDNGTAAKSGDLSNRHGC